MVIPIEGVERIHAVSLHSVRCTESPRTPRGSSRACQRTINTEPPCGGSEGQVHSTDRSPWSQPTNVECIAGTAASSARLGQPEYDAMAFTYHRSNTIHGHITDTLTVSPTTKRIRSLEGTRKYACAVGTAPVELHAHWSRARVFANASVAGIDVAVPARNSSLDDRPHRPTRYPDRRRHRGFE